jgi:hypothetical protein
MMSELRDSVEIAMRARSGVEGVPRIAPLIEVLGEDWALTDEGLESWTHDYAIPISRLNEDDWAKRIGSEAWANPEAFLDALDVATAYYSRPAG